MRVAVAGLMPDCVRRLPHIPWSRVGTFKGKLGFKEVLPFLIFRETKQVRVTKDFSFVRLQNSESEFEVHKS